MFFDIFEKKLELLKKWKNYLPYGDLNSLSLSKKSVSGHFNDQPKMKDTVATQNGLLAFTNMLR